MAKRKRKARAEAPKITVVPCPWDMGASGPANRIGLVVEDAPTVDLDTGKIHNPNGVKRSRRPPWIVRYAAKGRLTARQFSVADAIYRAGHGRLSDDPLAALFIDRVHGGDPQAAAFDARRAFHRLMRLVPDYAKPVVERVVVNDLPVWGQGGKSIDAHMDRLARGLDAVADALDAAKC